MVGDEGGFEISAALLRRGRDVPDMVAGLADRLERALPERVTTRRGALGRRLREVVIKVDPIWFRIELHGHRTTAWLDHVVRGVCIGSDEADFDDWLDRLAAALEAEATRSTQMRLALEDALR